jgi:hypothetical protein
MMIVEIDQEIETETDIETEKETGIENEIGIGIEIVIEIDHVQLKILKTMLIKKKKKELLKNDI